MDYYYKGYRFAKNPPLNPKDVKHLLEQSYWATKRLLETIAKSMENSLCFGVFTPENELVGFARIITDYAVTYFVTDVVIDEAHRNKSVGTHLIKYIAECEETKGLNGVLLTSYAHDFYEKLGFVHNAQKCMLRAATAEMHLNKEEDE